MKKEIKDTNCNNHYWGYRTIGGFAGHEHEHISGDLVCLNCELSLEGFIRQFLSQSKQNWKKELKEEFLKRIPNIKLINPSYFREVINQLLKEK